MEVSCIVASEFGLCRRDMKPGGLALQQDQMEFVKARCEPASMSRVRARQEGAQCTTSEVRGDAKYDREFALSNRRNMSIRGLRDQSAAEESISTLDSDHKRAVQTIKRLRGQPEIGLRFIFLPTKMCVLVYTDSAFHNADASLTKKDRSDDEWLAKAKQKDVRVRSQHGALVCVVAQDDLEKTEAIRISFMIWTRLRNEPSSLLLGLKPVHVEMLWIWQKTYEQCCVGVVIGVLTNGERSACSSERSLTVRVCLIVWPEDARVLEDRGTLTVASLRERCSAGVGRDQKRS